MALGRTIAIEDLVPGGILPTDHLHVGVNEGRCSRRRKEVNEDEVPLMLWPQNDGGHSMLIYCPRCMGWRLDA
jgi:hypothetical protein